MKVLIVFILILLVFYFAWQYIKRAIFRKFFKTFTSYSEGQYPHEDNIYQKETKNREFKKDIKWDAETVEFEEIPDTKDKLK